MALLGLRWIAAAALVGGAATGAMAACGGDVFTLAAADGGAGDDGGVTNDASGPEAGAIDADAPSFCATMGGSHLLCDDFDEMKSDMPSDDSKWMSFSASPLGDGRINADSWVSAPKSLSVFTSKASPNTISYAILGAPLGHARTFSLSFSTMIEAYGGDGSPGQGAAIASVTFGPVSYSLIAISATQIVVSETLTPDAGTKQTMTHNAPGSLPVGKWTKVQITLNLPQTTSMGSYSIAIGGTQGGDTLSYPTGLSPNGTLILGVYMENSSSAWRVRFDDVLVDKAL